MAHIVIIGGGVAAGSAAETLRDEGYDGDVTDRHRRAASALPAPAAVEGLPRGDGGEGCRHPASRRSGTPSTTSTCAPSTEALAIDPSAHRVETPGGDLAYDSLLLATGASPRRLPIEGHDLPGVHTLRTHRRLRRAGRGSSAAAVSGSCSSARAGSEWRSPRRRGRSGNDVTVLERDAVPLAAAVGPRDGRGVPPTPPTSTASTCARASTSSGSPGDGRAEGVVVDGETVPADLVLIGVGAVPNTGLATAAGITVDNGILTDASLRTSAPDVYAAGDVANAYHPVIQRHLRSEHWANALNAGPVAARVDDGPGRACMTASRTSTRTSSISGMELSGYPPLDGGRRARRPRRSRRAGVHRILGR